MMSAIGITFGADITGGASGLDKRRYLTFLDRLLAFIFDTGLRAIVSSQ
ncbi:MAG TPA: hypothetical protein VEI08_01595 [Candidatus Bathyarchaeia archaeon]|nr:hypothetical protein [Candidatus Bathyarchaeia archaeon]